jgi:hypothetical protein
MGRTRRSATSSRCWPPRNRAGYFTETSQPGEPRAAGYNGEMWVQRAGVTGYASTETLAALRARAATTPLILMAIPAARGWAGDGNRDT